MNINPAPRKPPETEPALLTIAALCKLHVPALREYFLTQWDWYTLQTLTLQISPGQMHASADPHTLRMRGIVRQISNTLMTRFGYSQEKSKRQVESWLDTAYQIPEDDCVDVPELNPNNQKG